MEPRASVPAAGGIGAKHLLGRQVGVDQSLAPPCSRGPKGLEVGQPHKVLGIPNSEPERMQSATPFPRMTEGVQERLQAPKGASQLSAKGVPLIGANATHRYSLCPGA